MQQYLIDLEDGPVMDLHSACNTGDLAHAKFLIESGSDVYQYNLHGWAPMHYAWSSGHDNLTLYFIEIGADFEFRTRDSGTNSLMMFAASGNDQMIKLFLRLNLDINAVDNSGHSALFYAVKFHQASSVHTLLKHGCNVNLRDSNGETALISACKTGNDQIVQYLLDYAADINVSNELGETALLIALKNNHQGIIKMLDLYQPNLKYPASGLSSSPLKPVAPVNPVPRRLDLASVINQARQMHLSPPVLTSPNAGPNPGPNPISNLVSNPVLNPISNPITNPSTSTDATDSLPNSDSMDELPDMEKLLEQWKCKDIFLPFFIREEVDVYLLLQLSESDLEKVGFKWGQRTKFWKGLEAWMNSTGKFSNNPLIQHAYTIFLKHEEERRLVRELKEQLEAELSKVQDLEEKLQIANTSASDCKSMYAKLLKELQAVRKGLHQLPNSLAKSEINDFAAGGYTEGMNEVRVRVDSLLMQLASLLV